jgi:hypothetical protein
MLTTAADVFARTSHVIAQTRTSQISHGCGAVAGAAAAAAAAASVLSQQQMIGEPAVLLLPGRQAGRQRLHCKH